jgi:hypothetical protein
MSSNVINGGGDLLDCVSVIAGLPLLLERVGRDE